MASDERPDARNGAAGPIACQNGAYRAGSSAAEQGTFNPRVLGSNPSRLTNLSRYSCVDARVSLARAVFRHRLTATLTATSNARDVTRRLAVATMDAPQMPAAARTRPNRATRSLLFALCSFWVWDAVRMSLAITERVIDAGRWRCDRCSTLRGGVANGAESGAFRAARRRLADVGPVPSCGRPRLMGPAGSLTATLTATAVAP